MSVLVVGLSHKSAPVSTLERAAVSGDTLGKLLHDVARLPDIAETFVISTCNRVEVYAEVGRFHGGVAGVCDLLSRYSGIPAAELTSSLYVHYEDRAVQHLLAVSSGLESMVVGEDQILGQVRTALKVAGDHGTLGRSLRDLGRLALRTGKRARAETGIDRLGLSLVSVGIELAAPHLGGAPGEGQDQQQACIERSGATLRAPCPRGGGRRDERAGRGHRRPGGGGAGDGRQPDPGQGRAARRRRRRRGRRLRRPGPPPSPRRTW